MNGLNEALIENAIKIPRQFVIFFLMKNDERN